MAPRWRNLAWIAMAQLFAMSTWFSVAAIGPGLTADWRISTEQLGLLTVSVQLGFVAGSIFVALIGLADWLSPRLLFAAAAVLAAGANALIIALAEFGLAALATRFLLGVVLAGVYPVGMKLMAGWFRGGRGLALGALVGALTLGTATPHLLAGTNLVGADSWRPVIVLTSLLAMAAAVITLAFVSDGPFVTRRERFRLGAALDAVRRPAVRYVTLGYLGHMWELYAMWTWIPAYLAASFAASGSLEPPNTSLAAAVVIGLGAIGCIAGGLVGDRIGHTRSAALAMVMSGVCAIACGLLFGFSPLLVLPVAALWGMSVIADSAQFSAAITVVSRPDEVGSVLALQTAVGFAVAAVSIQLLPSLVTALGWGLAIASLSIGPMIGTWAMLQVSRRGTTSPPGP